MKSKYRKFLLLLTAVLALMLLISCGGGGEEPAASTDDSSEVAAPADTADTADEEAAASEAIKVGLSFSDFATERWKNEEVLMRGLLEDMGYEVLSQEANHDVKLQMRGEK